MADYKQQFLEMLGLEIGEQFNLDGRDNYYAKNNPYHFNEAMYIIDKDGDKREVAITDIINGTAVIKKIEKFVDPIYCEIGDTYSTIMANGYQIELQFVGGSQDYYNRKMKNMFTRDAKLSKEQIDEIVKEIKS